MAFMLLGTHDIDLAQPFAERISTTLFDVAFEVANTVTKGLHDSTCGSQVALGLFQQTAPITQNGIEGKME